MSTSNAGARLRQILSSLLATLAVLLALELGLRGIYALRRASVDVVPLPYAVGHAYGPPPPWVDDQRILAEDPQLVWRGRPHARRRYMDFFNPVWQESDRSRLLRQFLPRLPASLARNPVWEVALNSEGFREAELRGARAPGAIRILCLGDSWTFGANVGPDETYPRRLEALLRDTHPGTSFEVLNLGVLGYSSFQGLELLRVRGLELDPDVLLIGFGMNDGKFGGFRDRDLPGEEGPAPLPKRIARLLERIELLKLLRYAVERSRWEPPSPGEALREAAGPGDGEGQPVDYDANEPWIRVSPRDYRENVAEMLRLARQRGAAAVLLHNEFDDEGPYPAVLRELSTGWSVPLVDSSALLAGERRRIEEGRARKQGLLPAGPVRGSASGVDVIFRVQQGGYGAPRGIFIAGVGPALGGAEPNRVRMHDDGTHGDEVAGDGVWSYRARFEAGTKVAYVYTNGGVAGRWVGLDVPHIRQFRIDREAEGSTWIRPVEAFGEITLQADPWHTNGRGYALIAEAVLAALGKTPEFRARLGATAGP